MRTLKKKCSSLPPVSPSRMMGFEVTSMISLMVLMRLVRSTSSMSGLPLKVESQRLLTHMASYSLTVAVSVSSMRVFSTIRPESPLEASITRTHGLIFSILRSFARRTSGVL